MKKLSKFITGFDKAYSITNSGDVISNKRNFLRKNGKPISVGFRILKPGTAFGGYLIINLNKNNQRKCYKIHRLVAEHFVPNPNNMLEVNHINGIKTDNNYSNLEWCNHKDNMKHAVDKGLVKTGRDSPNAKLTNRNTEKKIKKMYFESNFSLRRIARYYEVEHHLIKRIISQ